MLQRAVNDGLPDCALAFLNPFDLRGVLIDNLPKPHYNSGVVAFAQINSLHGSRCRLRKVCRAPSPSIENRSREVRFCVSAGAL